MNDEKYLFFSDCKEKKSIGASSFRKRTHTGKGGRMRLPSDSLTKKELEKMNGGIKSYRLNEPMSWQEFKSMPDDIKVMYIKLLREKFNVPGRKISDMMGVDTSQISRKFRDLGIAETVRRKTTHWDKEGWYAWCGLAPKPAKEKPETAAEEVPFTQKPICQIEEESLANEVATEPVMEMPKQERAWKCQ